MSYETFRARNGENAPGQFYVTSECLDCDLCRDTRPQIFARWEPHGYSYVKRQPKNLSERSIALELVDSCPDKAIHSDGDQFDWDSEFPTSTK